MDLVTNLPWKDDKESKDYYKKTRIDSHIYGGVVYSIMRVMIRSKAKNSKTKLPNDPHDVGLFLTSTLIIIKHNPVTNKPEKIMEKQLLKNVNEHDWCYSLKPYLLHKNIMFFSTFANDFEKEEINIAIEQFDFDT